MLAALSEAGIRTQAAVSPILPCDAVRLAALLAPVADRVVVDDLARGDGAGGARSRAALAELERLGHARWAGPAAADEAYATLRRETRRRPGRLLAVGVQRTGRLASLSPRQFMARRT